MRIGQGPKEESVGDAEHCRVGADSDTQREYNHQNQHRAAP